MMDRILLILLLLYLLLIIILQNPLFNDFRSNSNPITIVGNIGPITYEDGTLKIQYIGYPFVPFR
ncbi:hypothetical protein [Pseudalkalibacillus salsuginis]|uniref:hypothetical protein n=1 Tax=Pseudalkalibacillus salsuginis TaxID=2910972 RepID=UPI001F3CEBF8|nr:hypothetical protein [Pseudalkalibacillus salsuginis]MCF6411196.1 hypothetical protein [Pseudalkalibacillus salsuginis]